MARLISPHRFDELLRVAQETFIAKGYARTQMEDITKALGVGKGTIYGYVESKQALFDFALRHSADEHVPVPDSLPLPTPLPGATLRAVQEGIDAEAQLPRLRAAVSGPTTDARGELEAIIEELYDLLNENRVRIKLLERCSRDYPELHAIWHAGGRYAVLELVTQYIRRRVSEGDFAPMPDTRVAARVFLETLVTWAVHIYWDTAPDDIGDAEARANVSHYLTRALLVSPNGT
jgi:AcrR family transcriptional regulator